MSVQRGILQIVLATMLVVVQYGALTHQIWHLQHHPQTLAQQHEGNKQGSQSKFCDFHVAFAELLGAVNPAALPLRIAANTTERGASLPAFTFPATRVTPASRGPPVLV